MRTAGYESAGAAGAIPRPIDAGPADGPRWRERDVVFVSTGDTRLTAEQAADTRKMIMARMPEVADVIIVPGVAVTVHRTGGPA